jgi:hypothetical protein
MPFHAGVCVKELGSGQIMQGRLPFSSYDCGVLQCSGQAQNRINLERFRVKLVTLFAAILCKKAECVPRSS